MRHAANMQCGTACDDLMGFMPPHVMGEVNDDCHAERGGGCC